MMTTTLLSTSILAMSRVTTMLLFALSMVTVIGSILLLATFINKRITKKEEEAKTKNNEQ